MAKKKIFSNGYDRIKQNIILVMFVNIKGVHPREKNLMGQKMSGDTNKYQYKKKEDINRRNKKQKREQEKNLWKKNENRVGEVNI